MEAAADMAYKLRWAYLLGSRLLEVLHAPLLTAADFAVAVREELEVGSWTLWAQIGCALVCSWVQDPPKNWTLAYVVVDALLYASPIAWWAARCGHISQIAAAVFVIAVSCRTIPHDSWPRKIRARWDALLRVWKRCRRRVLKSWRESRCVRGARPAANRDVTGAFCCEFPNALDATRGIARAAPASVCTRSKPFGSPFSPPTTDAFALGQRVEADLASSLQRARWSAHSGPRETTKARESKVVAALKAEALRATQAKAVALKAEALRAAKAKAAAREVEERARQHQEAQDMQEIAERNAERERRTTAEAREQAEAVARAARRAGLRSRGERAAAARAAQALVSQATQPNTSNERGAPQDAADSSADDAKEQSESPHAIDPVVIEAAQPALPAQLNVARLIRGTEEDAELASLMEAAQSIRRGARMPVAAHRERAPSAALSDSDGDQQFASSEGEATAASASAQPSALCSLAAPDPELALARREHADDSRAVTNAVSSANGVMAHVCVACRSAEADQALLPCGHMCLCKECAKRWRSRVQASCPLCRARVRQVVHLFLS